MFIQGTKKLLDELGVKANKIGENKLEEFNPLFAWHGNLLRINKRKMVVLVNDKNQYVIVLYGLKKKDFQRFDEVVKEGIRKVFQEECIKEELIDKYLDSACQVKFRKTRNRSVVARMNNACLTTEYYAPLLTDDSSYQADVSKAVSGYLIGDGSGDYFYPYEQMYQDLEKFYGSPIFSCRAAVVKITLDLEGQSVWRRLVVPLNLTFYQFHRVLQKAFWWLDYHLHEFYIYDGDKHVVNLVCDNEAFAFPKDDWEMVHEQGIKLSDYIPKHKYIKYDYDFGDNWEHHIEVEKIIDDYDDNSPVCLDGEGNAPPEDVGGTGGFDMFLQIINDPDDEEYEDMIRWGRMQGYFEFDIDRINRSMKHVVR